MLTKVLLHEICEKLLAKEKHGFACVTDRVSPPGLYGSGEEPPIPEGHLRVHLGNGNLCDLPEDQVEAWLAEHVSGLVIWIVAEGR